MQSLVVVAKTTLTASASLSTYRPRFLNLSLFGYARPQTITSTSANFAPAWKGSQYLASVAAHLLWWAKTRRLVRFILVCLLAGLASQAAIVVIW